MTLTTEQILDRNIERAALSYKRSDSGRWAAAYFAAQVVGKYDLGATIALSNRMGCSNDTIENLAHAYDLYAELRAIPAYRLAVNSIRKLPYVYYSYFRALYKARNNYGLSLDQVFKILVDITQAEGTLHLEDITQHIQDKYGDTRTWHYFGQKAMKAIHKAINQPDIPDDVKVVLIPAYEKLGDQA